MTILVRPAPAWAGDVEEFRDVFCRRGWRGVERNYGACNDRLMKVVTLAGGLDRLQRDRADYQARVRAGQVRREMA